MKKLTGLRITTHRASGDAPNAPPGIDAMPKSPRAIKVEVLRTRTVLVALAEGGSAKWRLASGSRLSGISTYRQQEKRGFALEVFDLFVDSGDTVLGIRYDDVSIL